MTGYYVSYVDFDGSEHTRVFRSRVERVGAEVVLKRAKAKNVKVWQEPLDGAVWAKIPLHFGRELSKHGQF